MTKNPCQKWHLRKESNNAIFDSEYRISILFFKDLPPSFSRGFECLKFNNFIQLVMTNLRHTNVIRTTN